MKINPDWRATNAANSDILQISNVVPAVFAAGGGILLGAAAQGLGPVHIIKTVTPTGTNTADLKLQAPIAAANASPGVPFVYAPENATSDLVMKLAAAVNAIDRVTGDRTTLTGGSRVVSLDRASASDMARHEFRTNGVLQFALELATIGGILHLVARRYPDGVTPSDDIAIPINAPSALASLVGRVPAHMPDGAFASWDEVTASGWSYGVDKLNAPPGGGGVTALTLAPTEHTLTQIGFRAGGVSSDTKMWRRDRFAGVGWNDWYRLRWSQIELDSLYQALHTNLTALSGLTGAANKLPYFTGPGALALADLSSAGRALLDDASATDMLTTLGFSAFAKTLIDDANAAAIRSTLALGTMATEAAANYLAKSGGTMTGPLNLKDDTTWDKASGPIAIYFNQDFQLRRTGIGPALESVGQAVRFPGNPRVFSSRNSSSPVYGSGSTIIFDSIITDPMGSYSTGSGRFTAPVAGSYRVDVSFMLTGATGTPYIAVRRNGVTYWQRQAVLNQVVTLSLIVNILSAGDYIDIGTNGGSSVTYAAGYETSLLITYMG